MGRNQPISIAKRCCKLRLKTGRSLSMSMGEDAGESRAQPALRHWGFPCSISEIRFRDVAFLLIVALTIWGWVDVRRRGRIEPRNLEAHRTDFTVFTEAGSAFFDGRDPYRVTNPRGWFYLYPPLLALLVSPLSVFDGPAQVGVWYALSVAAAFGCYGECLRLWRFLAPTGN